MVPPWRSIRNVPLYLGSVGALTAALAAAVAAAAGFGPGYAVAAVACYALIAGGIALGLRRQRSRPPFGPASRITLLRAVLISLIAGLLAVPAAALSPTWSWIAVGLASAALALDGLDGWLARRFDHATSFGALFDQELDAFFILVLSLLVWHLDQVGAWALLIGVMRYALLAAGWLWPRLARPLPPSRRRKIVCGLQVGVLLVVLAPPVGPALAGPLAAVALAGLLYSFGADIIWLVKAPRPRREERSSERFASTCRHRVAGGLQRRPQRPRLTSSSGGTYR